MLRPYTSLEPQPDDASMIIPVQKDVELVEDFNSADNVTGALHVWWLGHSGYLIKWNGVGILIDPYLSNSAALYYTNQNSGWKRRTERTIDPLLLDGVDLILASNNHLSHLDPETILGIRASSPNVRLVIPGGITDEVLESMGTAGPHVMPLDAGSFIDLGDVEVHGINAASPEIEKAANGGPNTLGYVLTMGPFAVYYGGDTLWHSTLIKEIRRWNLNLALLPISGYDPAEVGTSVNFNGFEAAALAKGASAGLAVPCHYDMFLEDSISPEEFIYCCERLDQKYRILQPGSRMTMGPMLNPSSGKALPTEAYSGDWGLGY